MPLSTAATAAPLHGHALGVSEQLFVALRRFTPTNVVRMVALTGVLAPETLRRALTLLQERHPLLNVQLGTDAFEPTRLPIPLHVVARPDDQAWHVQFETLLNTPLPGRPGPLLQVHYLYGGARAELFVVGDHAICDGVSINALCAELLALCAGAPAGLPRPALPALDQLLPPCDSFARGRAFSGMFARFVRLAAQRALFEQRAGGHTTRLVTRQLTRDETRALLVRTREEGTTITAAVMAAALASVEAARATAPELAISVPVNLRPRLPEPLEAADLGHYTNVVYLAARRGGALWPRARTLQAQLRGELAGGRVLAALPAMYRTGRLFLRATRPPFAHVLISSSGVTPLGADYGAFRARDFVSGTSAGILSADFGFFVNTFDGRLRLNLLFLEEAVAASLAGVVLASLGERLRCA